MLNLAIELLDLLAQTGNGLVVALHVGTPGLDGYRRGHTALLLGGLSDRAARLGFVGFAAHGLSFRFQFVGRRLPGLMSAKTFEKASHLLAGAAGIALLYLLPCRLDERPQG